jgi:hypothetical protein
MTAHKTRTLTLSAWHRAVIGHNGASSASVPSSGQLAFDVMRK